MDFDDIIGAKLPKSSSMCLPSLTRKSCRKISTQGLYRPTEWSLEVSCERQKWSDSQANTIQTVLIVFRLRATLTAERRDSWSPPFKKALRALSRGCRRQRWKTTQVKRLSLMWLWQSWMLNPKLYSDIKDCSKARKLIKPQQAGCSSFPWQGLGTAATEKPECLDLHWRGQWEAFSSADSSQPLTKHSENGHGTNYLDN